MFETPDEQWTSTINSLHVIYYNTVIACIDGHTMNTMIQCSDSNDGEQPICSVATVIDTLFVDANTHTAYLKTATIKHVYD
jgi:hypothetical protein